MSRQIVVIGGGHNGLTTAILLAKAGYQVTVVEARERLGGLASREPIPRTGGGDTGYAVPGILHESSRLHRDVTRDLDLAQFGLSWRTPPRVWIAGESSGFWLSDSRVEGELQDGDAARYAEFSAFLRRISAVIQRIMTMPPPDPGGKLWPLIKTGWNVRKLGPKDMTELLRVGAMPVADWMHDLFAGESLRAAIALTAIDGAYMAPRSPGSSGNLLMRACTAGEEVVGGPAALIDALEQAARASGVTIRTGIRVERISLDEYATEVTGIRLDTGETIEASLLAASCNPHHAFLDLIGSRYLPVEMATNIANIRMRGITAKVHLGLSGPVHTRAGELFEHMRITGSLDDMERAFDAVKYGRFADKPVLDIRVPSIGDPSLCPEGHHVASIMAYCAPYALREGWTEDARDAFLRAVIKRAGAHIPGLEERIVASELFTPVDIEGRFGATGGHLYHGEHALDQLLFMRPTIECAQYSTPIQGLFLCGSGSHPGGGITCSPGALAARAILEQYPA